MSGDDNDRQPEVRFRQPRLHSEAVELWHVQVEDDTVRLMRFQGIEKLGPGRKGFDIEAGRTEQSAQSDANGFFIIHNCNQRPIFAHGSTLTPGSDPRYWTLGQ